MALARHSLQERAEKGIKQPACVLEVPCGAETICERGERCVLLSDWDTAKLLVTISLDS